MRRCDQLKSMEIQSFRLKLQNSRQSRNGDWNWKNDLVFHIPIVYFRFGWGVSGDCNDEDDLDGDRWLFWKCKTDDVATDEDMEAWPNDTESPWVIPPPPVERSSPGWLDLDRFLTIFFIRFIVFLVLNLTNRDRSVGLFMTHLWSNDYIFLGLKSIDFIGKYFKKIG